MAYQTQRQVTIESGTMQHEEIPLNRMDSTQRNAYREKIQTIFNTFDRDRNGFLDVKEVKRLIKANQCDSMPKGLAKRIIKMADQDQDGRLSFDEFYKMSLEHDWIVKGYVARYCKMIVPSPHRGTAFDEPESDDFDTSNLPCTYKGGVYGATVNDVNLHKLVFGRSMSVKDGQYESSMSCCPPPLTMVLFSIIEIITFLYDVFYYDELKSGNKLQTIGRSTRGPAASLFIYSPYKREESWRFLTYMFVHVGIMHLISNLIIQIFLGTALELVHSWWRVALVYLAGVVAGSMGTSLADPKIFLAGASGGVYALITAHIATIILNWHEMEYAVIQLFVFLIFCSVDLGQSIYNHVTDKNDQVGYIAHLSGAVAGLLVGIGVLRNLNERQWEKKLWWCAVSIYFILMIVGICIHIFVPNYFPKPRRI